VSNATSAPADLFEFDNTYATELDGFFAPWQSVEVATPRLVRFNRQLATSLGLDADALEGDLGASIFGGNTVPDGATPIAQAYAGHQFGGFNPQLGDGRALLLGEIVDPHGARYDIALKGSGRTPFSRGGDGRAALGPVLREYLMGEAMHALGIPTTRALAAVTTGEQVRRDRALPGAVLTRVAASHLRVGTFQFFAARGDTDKLRQLVGYALARHDPELASAPNQALALMHVVIERQSALIADWMNVGFIHGVMNTDNVTVSGETIDFGPCAFIEGFDPGAVFSSIDEGGRYAYGNQPSIGKWNMARLAEALLPLLADDEDRAVQLATEALDRFDGLYLDHWLAGARRKLGLTDAHDSDFELLTDWLELLAEQHVDFTLAWRRLAAAAEGDEAPLRALFENHEPLAAWLAEWRDRIAVESIEPAARAAAMREISPIYIARNHLVEEALAAAVNDDDLKPFERLLEVVTEPFAERLSDVRYAHPAPPEFTAGYRTFCGT
jgi:uncharacterized protein YdiU (UPF0061 family)